MLLGAGRNYSFLASYSITTSHSSESLWLISQYKAGRAGFCLTMWPNEAALIAFTCCSLKEQLITRFNPSLCCSPVEVYSRLCQYTMTSLIGMVTGATRRTSEHQTLKVFEEPRAGSEMLLFSLVLSYSLRTVLRIQPDSHSVQDPQCFCLLQSDYMSLRCSLTLVV